uniref:Nicotinate degradation protein R n=1 Tax=Sym plasmid TaxID=28430 RepID=A0A515HIQ5_9ZZZZ|nr:Nicotinate degradation protein R [Sym plasmid]
MESSMNERETARIASRVRPPDSPVAGAAGEVSALAELHARPGFLFRRAGQLVAQFAEQEAAKIGLTAPQHVCLIALNRCAALDQISLGKALGMDRATVGEVIRRLEARALVERASDGRDARRKIVALTSQGRQLVPAAEAAAESVSEYMLGGLAPDERKQLTYLLSKAVGALNAASVTPVELPRIVKDSAQRPVQRIIEIGCICSMFEDTHRMTLTADERGEMEAVIRRRSGSAALARRARCVWTPK